MTAQEQQAKRVIAGTGVLVIGGRRDGGHFVRGGVLAAAPCVVAAPLVDQPPGGHADEPASGIIGNALGGPLNAPGQERLLHGVLAFLEAAVTADERAEDLRRQLAEQVLGGTWRGQTSAPESYMTGRTSIAKYRASGQRAAISTARSGVSQSMAR